MPLPTPRSNEEQQDFVSRCIRMESKASPGRDPKQIQAMCYTAWRDRNKQESLEPKSNLIESGSGPVELRDEILFEGAEFVESEGSKVIKNVAMVGQQSGHGYSYRPTALQSAISNGLYEGVQLFVDHSPKNQSRSVMSLGGVFKNVRFEGGKVRGDAVLLSDQYGDKVWNVAQLQKESRIARGAGFSHVASGKLKRENGQAFVEEITNVLSVDLVTTPATNTNIFEGETEMDWKDVTPESLRSNRPEVANAIYQEGVKSRDDEVNKIMTEKTDLEKKVDEFQVKEAVAKRRSVIEKMLNESKLPSEAKTDVFRRSLESADGEEWEKTVKEMIDDRAKIFGGVKGMGDESSHGDDKVSLKEVRDAFGS